MKPWLKNYKFDLVIKDKGYTGVMNIHETFFLSDTPMYSIHVWYANVKAKRSYDLDRNLQTDRHTDGRRDRVIPIYLLHFIRG